MQTFTGRKDHLASQIGLRVFEVFERMQTLERRTNVKCLQMQQEVTGMQSVYDRATKALDRVMSKESVYVFVVIDDRTNLLN